MKIISRKTISKKEGKTSEALDFTEIEKLLEALVPQYSSKDSSVYHYTTVDALFDGIIPKDKDEKLTLRATDSNYMNDPNELKVDWANFIEDTKHLEFISSMTKGVNVNEIKPIENIFLLSFSKNRDYLPMWSMYGKDGNGIVLEFDKRRLTTTKNPLISCLYPRSDAYYFVIKLLEKVFDAGNKYNFTKGRFFLTLDKIRYNKSDYKDRRDRVKKDCNCESCLQDFGTLILLLFYPFVAHKHGAYDYERESRLIVNNDKLENVKFRCRDGMLIPFIDRKINRSALKSIIIGPTQDFERSKKSLQMFLKSKGFEKVKIHQSNVPYRK